MWKLVKAESNYRNAMIHMVIQVSALTVFIFIIAFIVMSYNEITVNLSVILMHLSISLFFIASVNQLSMLDMEVKEKRARYFSLLPLKQVHVAYARLLTPVMLHCIFYLAIAAIALNYTRHPELEEEGISIARIFISAFLIFLAGVSVLRLFSEFYGKILLGAIAALSLGWFLMLAMVPRLNSDSDWVLQRMFLAPARWISEVDLIFLMSLIIVVCWVVVWVSFVKRRSYLK